MPEEKIKEEEKLNLDKLIDKELKEKVINKLLQYVKEEVEKDLKEGLRLINNFNQYDVNNYMDNLSFKYGVINRLYILLKYGPSSNNNANTVNYDYSKTELYEQVCVVNAVKQTLEIKDDLDKYKKLLDSLIIFINNINNIKKNNNIN